MKKIVLYLKDPMPSKVTEVNSVTTNLRWICDNSKVVHKTIDYLTLVESPFSEQDLILLDDTIDMLSIILCAICNLKRIDNEKEAICWKSISAG